MTRGSGGSNWAGRAGRRLRVNVILLIFKDEKTKDTVTYYSWWWGVAIFCCSGLDDWHLLPDIFWSLHGFPGDLDRSLGEDATLTNILQTLDVHYGVVMTFNTLSKELYSLKQGSRENVSEFRVCLLQQVQILQSEYLGRIQQEHVEEMKWDHFYKGLNPEYRHMLAHKVDSKHPTSYSDFLLAVKKLERWAETRDPLLPKTTMTGGSNVTGPLASGNLFPSRKLKDNHTFMAQSAIVESVITEGDSTTEVKEEKEVESSEGNPESPVKLVEQISISATSYGLLLQLIYTKRKTRFVSGAAILTTWWKIVQRISSRSPEK